MVSFVNQIEIWTELKIKLLVILHECSTCSTLLYFCPHRIIVLTHPTVGKKMLTKMVWVMLVIMMLITMELRMMRYVILLFVNQVNVTLTGLCDRTTASLLKMWTRKTEIRMEGGMFVITVRNCGINTKRTVTMMVMEMCVTMMLTVMVRNCLTVARNTRIFVPSLGISYFSDNCPTTFNSDLTDTDDDKIGDACDNCKFVKNINQVTSMSPYYT